MHASFPTERIHFPVPSTPFQSQRKLYTNQTVFLVFSDIFLN